MINLRAQVWAWYQQGMIEDNKVANALTVASDLQHPVDWQKISAKLLLWFGALCFSAGIIFFFAFNWQDLSKFGKFALIESLIIISTLAYALLRWQERSLNPCGLGASKANAALFVLSILLGGLLALIGQTYQTGADPWQLFAIWAILIMPLAYLAGFEVLWLMLLALLNLALLLYFQTWPTAWGLLSVDFFPLFVATLFNSFIYSLLLSAYKFKFARFNAPRCQSLSILIALSTLTWLGVWSALMERSDSTLPQSFYWLSIIVIFLMARFVVRQLLPLALACFSMIAVLTVLLSVNIFSGSESIGAFFLIAMFIIGSTAGVSMWLTKTRILFHHLSVHQATKEPL